MQKSATYKQAHQYERYVKIIDLKAPKPPKRAPDARPTQNPRVNPILILSQQLGPLWYPPTGTGMAEKKIYIKFL